MARQLDRRVSALECTLHPGQRIFVHWPEGHWTEGADPATPEQLDEAAAQGWDVVMLFVVYDDHLFGRSAPDGPVTA